MSSQHAPPTPEQRFGFEKVFSISVVILLITNIVVVSFYFGRKDNQDFNQDIRIERNEKSINSILEAFTQIVERLAKIEPATFKLNTITDKVEGINDKVSRLDEQLKFFKEVVVKIADKLDGAVVIPKKRQY